jgi:UDP-2,3-diacylglucosamine hydrolase
MSTLFISDLHLSEHRPDLTAAFLRFLQQQAPHAQALYILGDLFEFWIGDDERSPLQLEIAEALATLSQQGVALYYIHGNRDFMIGKAFARASGMTLLPAEFMLNLYGRRTLLLHGDQLCTLDEKYQRFRRITSWRWLRWIFLRLPLSKRLEIAGKMRQGKKGKSLMLMDVTPEAVAALMHRHQTSLMIHGHTHKPAIHALGFEVLETCGRRKPAERIVLGDWDAVFTYLQADGDGTRLIELPISPSS